MSRSPRRAPRRSREGLALAVASLALAAPLFAGLAAHDAPAVAAVVAAYLAALFVTAPGTASWGEILARLGGGALMALSLYGAGLGIGWGTGWQPPVPVWLPAGLLVAVAVLWRIMVPPVPSGMDRFLDRANRELETAAAGGPARTAPRAVPTTLARRGPEAAPAALRRETRPAAPRASETAGPEAPEDTPPDSPTPAPARAAAPFGMPDAASPEQAEALAVLGDAIEQADRTGPPAEGPALPSALLPEDAVAHALSLLPPPLIASWALEQARARGRPRDRQALTQILALPPVLEALSGSRPLSIAFEEIVSAGCRDSLSHWIATVDAELVPGGAIIGELPEIARMTTISRELEGEDEALADALVALAARIEDILLGEEE